MLRPATRRDLDGLLALEAACFGDRRFGRDALVWLLADPNGATLVEDRDGVVASIMIAFEPESCRVLSVAVLPGWRRRGLGRALMRAAENLARDRGSRTICLEVGVRNAGAIEFYKRLGYKIDDLLPAYYTDGEDAYAMRRPLPEGNA